MSAKAFDFLGGIPTGFFAQSSQNGQPVSGEKCQRNLARVRVELLLRLFGSGRRHDQSGSCSCFGSGSRKEAIKPTR